MTHLRAADIYIGWMPLIVNHFQKYSFDILMSLCTISNLPAASLYHVKNTDICPKGNTSIWRRNKSGEKKENTFSAHGPTNTLATILPTHFAVF